MSGKSTLAKLALVRVSQKAGSIPQRLVDEFSAAFEVANGSGNNPRKLCVHCYVGKVVHNIADRLQLLVEIVLPYLSDTKNLTGGRF